MKYFKPVVWEQEDTLHREQADDELRLQLIRQFVKNNSVKATEISDAIISGDLTRAHRLAHTLKGNAAQLSKTSLQHVAGEIEDLLKDGINHVNQHQLETLESELNAVIEELKPLIREVSRPDTTESPMDSVAADSLLSELKLLLEDRDADCLALIDDLKLIQGTKEVINHLESIDFKQALDELNRLMNSGKKPTE